MSEHVTDWLNAYHDGELTERQRKRVEAHLAECASCRAELEQLRFLSAALRESPLPSDFLPPELFVAQVGLQLPRRPEGPAPRKALWVAWRLTPLVLLGALVFLQTVLLVTGLTRVAVGLGLGGETAATLLPVRTGGLWQAVQLNLILPGVIALLYLSWLASWWSRRQQQENRS